MQADGQRRGAKLSISRPQLPCWSLIARTGNGQPFEVGTDPGLHWGAVVQ